MNKNKNLDWRGLNLAQDEIELLESVEKGEWKSIGNVEKRREELRKFFNPDYTPADDAGNISLKIPKKDLANLKLKSKKLGINYDALISKLIHDFAQDRINVSL